LHMKPGNGVAVLIMVPSGATLRTGADSNANSSLADSWLVGEIPNQDFLSNSVLNRPSANAPKDSPKSRKATS
jgi:hypothetical protein